MQGPGRIAGGAVWRGQFAGTAAGAAGGGGETVSGHLEQHGRMGSLVPDLRCGASRFVGLP